MKKIWIGVGVVIGVLLVFLLAVKLHFVRARAAGRPVMLEQIRLAEDRLLESYADLELKYPDWAAEGAAEDEGFALWLESVKVNASGYRQLVAIHDDLLDPDYVVPERVQDILRRVDEQ